MILSKRNFLIGATASLGIIAAPAIVRCESLMAIRAIEIGKRRRYLTFLEIIYPGVNEWKYATGIEPVFCYNPGSQEIKTREHMYNVNKLDKNFLCNKMIMPVYALVVRGPAPCNAGSVGSILPQPAPLKGSKWPSKELKNFYS